MINFNAVILSLFLGFFCCIPTYAGTPVVFNPPVRYLSLVPLVERVSRDDLRKYLMLFLEKTHPSRLVGSPGHAKSPTVISEILKGLETTNPQSQTNCCLVTQEVFTPDFARARDMYQLDFEQQIANKFATNDPTYIKWKKFTDDTLRFIHSLNKVSGTNVVWERKGTIDPDSILILGAHFDSIVHDHENFKIMEKAKTQGADDNGSGVAVAISLIKLLSQIPLPKTVRIIFYDFGQIGSLGAVEMVKKNREMIKSPKFAGHVDLIRLGYDSRDRDTEKKYGNMALYLRDSQASGHERAQKLAHFFQDAAKTVTSGINFEVKANDFNQGNGAAYWDLDAPTLIFSQNMESDMNPNFHTGGDFAETLNYQTLYKSYQYIASGVLAWAFDIVK